MDAAVSVLDYLVDHYDELLRRTIKTTNSRDDAYDILQDVAESLIREQRVGSCR